MRLHSCSVHHLICKCDVKITHGGANDLTQYAKSKGYIETERMLLSSKSISDFFPSKSDIQTKVSGNDWSEWVAVAHNLIHDDHQAKTNQQHPCFGLAWIMDGGHSDSLRIHTDSYSASISSMIITTMMKNMAVQFTLITTHLWCGIYYLVILDLCYVMKFVKRQWMMGGWWVTWWVSLSITLTPLPHSTGY